MGQQSAGWQKKISYFRFSCFLCFLIEVLKMPMSCDEDIELNPIVLFISIIHLYIIINLESIMQINPLEYQSMHRNLELHIENIKKAVKPKPLDLALLFFLYAYKKLFIP